MKKKEITIKDVLLYDFFLDSIFNDSKGNYEDELGLFNNNSVESLLLQEARSVINFENEDKCTLPPAELDGLKQRIINSILQR